MNHIKNPSALEKRQAERRTRRKRPNYPKIGVGKGTLLHRGECGVNVGLTDRIKGPPITLEGRCVFERATPKSSRSKYAPHVGKKQDRKLVAKLNA